MPKAKTAAQDPAVSSPPTSDVVVNRFVASMRSQKKWKQLTPLERHTARVNCCWYYAIDLQLHAMWRIPQQIEEIVWPKECDARDGRLGSLRFLALLAFEATAALNAIAREYPDFVRLVSGNFPRWPVLCSGVQRISDENFEMLTHIGIPKADQCTSDHRWLLLALSKKGLLSTPLPGRWACFLHACIMQERLFNLEEYRAISKYIQTPAPISNPADHNGLLPDLPRNWNSLIKARFSSRIKALPLFSAKTAPAQWWNLAQEILLTVTGGKPETLPSLKTFVVKRTKVQNSTHGLEPTPGVIRAEIIKDIQQAFIQLAERKKGRGRPSAKQK